MKFHKPPEGAPPADNESKEAPSPPYSPYLEDSLSPLSEKVKVEEKRGDNGNGIESADKPEQLTVSSSNDEEEEEATNGPRK